MIDINSYKLIRIYATSFMFTKLKTAALILESQEREIN